jgi:hypothetical protein
MTLKSWDEVMGEHYSPEQIAEIDREAEVILVATELNQLRKARRLLRRELECRIEKRRERFAALNEAFDPRLGSVREAIEAMGGELRLTAHFPDGEYPLDSLSRAPEATPAE